MRSVRPEADIRQVWKAMGLQWDDGAIGSQGKVKSSTKCATKKVSSFKNPKQGAKAVSWEQNVKTGSTSTCYAPHQKNLAGGKVLKGAGNGILRGFTPNQDRTGGWGKGRGNFVAVVMVPKQVVSWRRRSTLGIAVRGSGRREMVPWPKRSRFWCAE